MGAGNEKFPVCIRDFKNGELLKPAEEFRLDHQSTAFEQQASYLQPRDTRKTLNEPVEPF
jgi:hypothetical protein